MGVLFVEFTRSESCTSNKTATQARLSTKHSGTDRPEIAMLENSGRNGRQSKFAASDLRAWLIQHPRNLCIPSSLAGIIWRSDVIWYVTAFQLVPTKRAKLISDDALSFHHQFPFTSDRKYCTFYREHSSILQHHDPNFSPFIGENVRKPNPNSTLWLLSFKRHEGRHQWPSILATNMTQ